MNFKKVVPYKLKRLVPMLGMAGATLLGGCEKEETLRDVELRFTNKDCSSLMYMNENNERCISDVAKEYVEDETVRYIYLVPEGPWYTYVASSITGARHNVFERMFEYSPKFRGKGDFDFYPGAASQVPADSLWYVSKGWTINKYRYNKQH